MYEDCKVHVNWKGKLKPAILGNFKSQPGHVCEKKKMCGHPELLEFAQASLLLLLYVLKFAM